MLILQCSLSQDFGRKTVCTWESSTDWDSTLGTKAEGSHCSSVGKRSPREQLKGRPERCQMLPVQWEPESLEELA